MKASDRKRLDKIAYALAHELFGSECVLAAQFHPDKFTGPVQAAHVIPKRHLATRWNLQNYCPLCPPCHYFYDNHRPEYVAAVRAFVGEETWAMLMQAKRTTARDNGARLCYEEAVASIYAQAEEMRRDGN